MPQLHCRDKDCNKPFTDISNRRRHEIKSGHYQEVKHRSSSKEPLHDAETKLYSCPNVACTLAVKKKGNMIRHIEKCEKQKAKKKTKAGNKTCEYCGAVFKQKSNRDRHVRSAHYDESLSSEFSANSNETGTSTSMTTMVSSTQSFDESFHSESGILDVSFVRDNGEVFDLNMSIIDEKNQIYEVFDADTDYLLSNVSSTANITTDTLNVTTEITNSTTDVFTPCTASNDVTLDLPVDLMNELEKKGADRDKKHENTFTQVVLKKLECDFKSSTSKHSAAKFLHESFGEMLEDYHFIRWLSKKLDFMRPYKLIAILKNYHADHIPRNTLPDDVPQKIYDFWLLPENSIQTTDRRTGRDEVRITKMSYLRDYKHLQKIEDSNIAIKEVVMKKTGNTKSYVAAQRMVYTKPIRELHKTFISTKNVTCSISSFIKYKPFYVGVPTEREKESCLCMKCQNMHLRLKGINTYRTLKKLSTHSSVTNFLNDITSLSDEEVKKRFPENSDQKAINYYVFESKHESYLKNGEEIKYTRTTRVDKNEKVWDLVASLRSSAKQYLRHRSHVQNIASVLPIIRESFEGRYIELDFSENIAMKPKFEVQDAHFSGRQYTLHCSLVHPGETKYVFHLSDDTKHDPCFVHEVLDDIFQKWSIENETIIIKSDNAPTQYKNKYAFFSYQNLANKYNVRIIRIYGAAGHGKGLIDAMSSFGVKSILRRDIVSHDVWFSNSVEICEYLKFRGDKRMYYSTVDPVTVDKNRQDRQEHVIDHCMINHLFDYKPHCNEVLIKEYLCDCELCLRFEFDQCLRLEEDIDQEETVCPPQVANEDCELDEVNHDSQIYEFVDVASYIALASYSTNEPIYIIQVSEKGEATEKLTDRYGHVIMPGEKYFKGKYLQQTRSRVMNIKQFKLIEHVVYCLPEEVFEAFLEIESNLSMKKVSYDSIVARL